VSAATPGEAAFEAHRDKLGGVRPWSDVRDPEREVWEATGQAAIDAFLAGDSVSAGSIREALAAREPQPAPELATVDLHRWYAVINQPDGTSKVIGHTDDGLGYYDSVDEWEAKNS
jgi:hypothetical protein